MSVTITLDQDLARRLRSQAKARNLSVQEWARTILANASERPDAPETWLDLNARRLALIKKRYKAGLTDAEEKELTRLQEAAAKVFEPADRRRREHVHALVKEATGSADE